MSKNLRLTFRRQQRESGQRGVCGGERGWDLSAFAPHQLRCGSLGTKVGWVASHRGGLERKSGWYWVAVCSELGVPLKNTSECSIVDPEEAKRQLKAYVLEHLNGGAP